MLKFLNKYKKILIAISFGYIYMFVVFIVPSGYGLYTPGEITKIDHDIYDIEGVDFSNDFNTVSVYSWHELTVFQKWAVSKSNEYDLHKQTALDETLSISDVNKRGKISKESSHQLAIITAYENANKVDSEITIDYKFNGLTVYTNFGKFLPIGTLVVGVDNLSLLDDPTITYEDLYLETLIKVGDNNYFRKTSMVLTLEDGSKVNVDYDEDSEEFMSFYPKFEIINTNPYYNESPDKRNVGGPSGGMMQALAIYSALLDIDLSHLKIAGTGTINLTGNYSVGSIGGLVQKYYTVVENNVDVFIVPGQQFTEIREHVNEEKINVFYVNKFSDVIIVIETLLGATLS